MTLEICFVETLQVIGVTAFSGRISLASRNLNTCKERHVVASRIIFIIYPNTNHYCKMPNSFILSIRNIDDERSRLSEILVILADLTNIFRPNMNLTNNLTSETKVIVTSVCKIFINFCINPYPTAFPYGNGMVLHFY